MSIWRTIMIAFVVVVGVGMVAIVGLLILASRANDLLVDAAWHSKTSIAKVALWAGGDPNYRGQDGLAVLEIAILGHNALIVPIDANGDPVEGEATRPDNTEMVRILLEAGADPNTRNEDGELVLADVVRWGGDPEIVRMLLEAGADPNARNTDGEHILIGSVESLRYYNGDAEVVRLLLEAGADPNTRDADGEPVLAEAVWRGDAEVVRLLLDAGADPNTLDADGKPVLAEAVWRGNTEIVQLLWDAGVTSVEATAMLAEAGWTVTNGVVSVGSGVGTVGGGVGIGVGTTVGGIGSGVGAGGSAIGCLLTFGLGC